MSSPLANPDSLEPAITAEDLEAAVHGHIDRTTVTTPEEIMLLVLGVGVEDPMEYAVLVSLLKDLRLDAGMAPGEGPAWAGGVIDGFLIGVRALRFALQREGITA